jgi:hypothetical protein
MRMKDGILRLSPHNGWASHYELIIGSSSCAVEAKRLHKGPLDSWQWCIHIHHEMYSTTQMMNMRIKMMRERQRTAHLQYH